MTRGESRGCDEAEAGYRQPIQSTLADMMEWAIAEIDATSGSGY
jgi:hypothetical protein